MFEKRKAKAARQRELQALQNEIQTLHSDLDELYSRFDRVTEPSQVEACIYEMNALRSKYDYAVKCLKAWDGGS